MSWFYKTDCINKREYMTQNIYEIDLTRGNSDELPVEDIIRELDQIREKNSTIKLKLNSVELNQSQLIFIKTLIEGYGHKLTFVQTTSEKVRELCSEMQINSTNANFETINVKEAFNNEENQITEENKETTSNENKIEEFENKENTEFEQENNNIEDSNSTKQTISVYRKAEEEENTDIDDEDVDFYATKTDLPVVADTKNTIYINQTLRNGQVLEYDGNVVIIGDCHPGSEIKATGDITVWGVLGSIAHAGIKGNKEAKIRALKMNAVQLRIADCYSRRPDGTNIPYIVKSSEFTPEEARIADDNIVLYKVTQN